MKITLSARRFEPTERLQTFARKEVNKLERYFDGDLSGQMILEENGSRKIFDVRLNVLGKVLPVRIEGNDFYKIIPKAVNKLERQLKSQKAKVTKR